MSISNIPGGVGIALGDVDFNIPNTPTKIEAQPLYEPAWVIARVLYTDYFKLQL